MKLNITQFYARNIHFSDFPVYKCKKSFKILAVIKIGLLLKQKLEMIFGDTLPEKVLVFFYNFWKYIHVETSGKIRIKANLKPYAN